MIYFIGAGPSDPELLTRKAWRILGAADVIPHDASLDSEQLRTSFPAARWINVGKRASKPSVDQRFICRLMIAHARRGDTLVRLKGGNPTLFGGIAEEIEACRAHSIPFEIVSGVTTACAAASDLQTSLTLRGISRNVAFVTSSIGKHECFYQSFRAFKNTIASQWTGKSTSYRLFGQMRQSPSSFDSTSMRCEKHG